MLFEKRLKKSGVRCDAVVVKSTRTASSVGSTPESAKKHGIMLIVDDIQVGCGRTGTFFSFEPFDIKPDIVCLSKALSGYGLPLSLVLMKPEHDQFDPGEHNGTFRGHNLAFVTATAALDEYWADHSLSEQVKANARQIRDALLDLANDYEAEVRGRGMIQGIEFADKSAAAKISREAFRQGLMIETSGPDDEVVKCLPPLTISEEGLTKGLEILQSSVRNVLGTATINTEPDSALANRGSN